MNIKNICLATTIIALFAIVSACSSQKNTATSRWWQSFNTRYNVFYNAKVAYIEGALEKERANKDNYTELLPLYTVGNKATRRTGKANFDRAIEKSQKAIKLHSIKKKPEWTKKRRKTDKDKEWLARKEYNPFLWKAWLLMGRSQFYKGDFDEAAATFSYMTRLYKTQPAIAQRAKAWLAKCYIEQGWIYDAEDVIRNMQRDSMHWRAKKEWNYTLADYYIHTQNYENAVIYLERVIKQEMRKKQKAREWFLMGQLQEQLGNIDKAYKAYKHVVALNPTYETEFNARIAMTEVMANKKSKTMIAKLKRMAASDKNKDYKGRIYYALGNIFMAQKDTTNAIANYELGRQQTDASGVEKGVLLLKLGDIYWQKEKYAKAKSAYGEAVGNLDKERKDYEQISQRSVMLDNLVPFTNEVDLQDSLQTLVAMPEKQRLDIIDRAINELKKREKEERRKQQEEFAKNMQSENGGEQFERPNNQITPQNNNANNNSGNSSLWYFYNQQVVNQGKTAFERLWGKRKNADDWQRTNKTVVNFNDNNNNDNNNQNNGKQNNTSDNDSISNNTNTQQNNETAEKDSALAKINDPHFREYYLAQLPFTPQQMKESNDKLAVALYGAGVVFKDQIENFKLSEKYLLRSLKLSDDTVAYIPNIYYHLFLLYSRLNNGNRANNYLQLLKDKYPKNQLTSVLTDPYFVENALYGKQKEDSLYTDTYNAFKENNYSRVENNATFAQKRFPNGANSDKFMFVDALAKLNNNKPEEAIKQMENLLKTFPQSKLSTIAGNIINGVRAGRKLQNAKFDMSKMWQQRTDILNNKDSATTRVFTKELNTDFMVMMAYKLNSIDRNKLLYAVAKYNFMNYPVRNFEINVEQVDSIEQLQVRGFNNFDQALVYARALRMQNEIAVVKNKTNIYVISYKNAELMGRTLTYNDYEVFYNKNFSQTKMPPADLLSQPEEFVTPQEVKPKNVDNNNSQNNQQNNNSTTIIVDDSQNNNNNNQTGTIIVDENIDNNSEDNNNSGSTTVILEPQPQTQPQTQQNSKQPVANVAQKMAKILQNKNNKNNKNSNAKNNKANAKTTSSATQKNNAQKTTTPNKVSNNQPITTKTGIYFGDGFGASQTNSNNAQGNNKNNNKKDKGFDATDEYYELEGF